MKIMKGTSKFPLLLFQPIPNQPVVKIYPTMAQCTQSPQLYSHPNRSGLGQLALARGGADGFFSKGCKVGVKGNLGNLTLAGWRENGPFRLSRCISYATWGHSSYRMLVYQRLVP